MKDRWMNVGHEEELKPYAEPEPDSMTQKDRVSILSIVRGALLPRLKVRSPLVYQNLCLKCKWEGSFYLKNAALSSFFLQIYTKHLQNSSSLFCSHIL